MCLWTNSPNTLRVSSCLAAAHVAAKSGRRFEMHVSRELGVVQWPKLQRQVDLENFIDWWSFLFLRFLYLFLFYYIYSYIFYVFYYFHLFVTRPLKILCRESSYAGHFIFIVNETVTSLKSRRWKCRYTYPDRISEPPDLRHWSVGISWKRKVDTVRDGERRETERRWETYAETGRTWIFVYFFFF